MMTDPIADLLTHIRNANSIRMKKISMPSSRVKVGVTEILKQEGFIESYELEEGTPFSKLHIRLKYGPDGEQVIRSIERVSKPGCRVYTKSADIPRVLRGLGITVLSTPKGIISGREAREQKVGGEILCKVY